MTLQPAAATIPADTILSYGDQTIESFTASVGSSTTVVLGGGVETLIATGSAVPAGTMPPTTPSPMSTSVTVITELYGSLSSYNVCCWDVVSKTTSATGKQWLDRTTRPTGNTPSSAEFTPSATSDDLQSASTAFAVVDSFTATSSFTVLISPTMTVTYSPTASSTASDGGSSVKPMFTGIGVLVGIVVASAVLAYFLRCLGCMIRKIRTKTLRQVVTEADESGGGNAEMSRTLQSGYAELDATEIPKELATLANRWEKEVQCSSACPIERVPVGASPDLLPCEFGQFEKAFSY